MVNINGYYIVNDIVNNILVGGIPTPLKNHGVKASWDDEIPFPTEWKVIKDIIQMFQTTKQSKFLFYADFLN